MNVLYFTLSPTYMAYFNYFTHSTFTYISEINALFMFSTHFFLIKLQLTIFVVCLIVAIHIMNT